jgi:hypothetical protein
MHCSETARRTGSCAGPRPLQGKVVGGRECNTDRISHWRIGDGATNPSPEPYTERGGPTTNSSETAGRIGSRAPAADSARQTRRKGGRFVPASTDSLLSVTFMSLRVQTLKAKPYPFTLLMTP